MGMVFVSEYGFSTSDVLTTLASFAEENTGY